ncbi:hypothetical protein Q9R32_04930 [Actinotalea sp. AC32]|nr:hypothetical protein [Actinotalea sp. AC32]
MDGRHERATVAVSVPMSTGPGVSPGMGVAAPIGAVSRKDRERARATALRREGPSHLLLLSALPGSVLLQRRGTDGSWTTISKRTASRSGRTRIELPHAGDAAPSAVRVVFSPKNANITSWISQTVDA